MNYSRLGHAIESAYLRRGKGVLVASLVMYMDDSGTSPSNQVAVAAGWISTLVKWKQFELDWGVAKKIKGDEFDCFHTSECVSGKLGTEFENWSYPMKKKVLSRLRSIVKQRALKGFCLGVTKKDYDELVPSDLRKVRGEYHYTWVVRGVLGMIHTWRKNNNILDPIEYVFDWLKPNDPRRKEIENAFAAVEGNVDALRDYGVQKGCCQFRDRCAILPLQAADILAWTIYRGIQHENSIQSANEIARLSFADFIRHRNGRFVEGGYANRRQVEDWAMKAMSDRGRTW